MWNSRAGALLEGSTPSGPGWYAAWLVTTMRGDPKLRGEDRSAVVAALVDRGMLLGPIDSTPRLSAGHTAMKRRVMRPSFVAPF